jgi:hypothetical protein
MAGRHPCSPMFGAARAILLRQLSMPGSAWQRAWGVGDGRDIEEGLSQMEPCTGLMANTKIWEAGLNLPPPVCED